MTYLLNISCFAKTLDLSWSVPDSRRLRKSKNFPNIIKYFSFVAGDFIVYRYSVHESNVLVPSVTVDDDGPSVSLFSNTFLFTYISQDPLKRTNIVTGSVGFDTLVYVVHFLQQGNFIK